MLATEVRSGDAPKPPFAIKTNKEREKFENQDSINHPYFWVCKMCGERCTEFRAALFDVTSIREEKDSLDRYQVGPCVSQ